MTRRRFAALSAGLGFSGLGSAVCGEAAPPEPASPPEWKRFEHEHATMGTVFRFLIYSRHADQAEAAFDAAANRLDALNASLSDYLASSEVSRLSASSGRPEWRLLLPDVWTVLAWGQTLARQTGGAFDVTIGPLTRLWRVSRRQGKLPSPARLQEAREATGHAFLEMDPEGRRARLARQGMRLDLGGIAKGYAVDEALKTLQAHGITSALVDGGGDLRALGSPPGMSGWRVTVEDLDAAEAAIHMLSDSAMATSGDLYQSLRIEGREFSHLIDPKTGLGLEFRRSVTVMAPDAMTADALASALSVLDPAESRRLLTEHYPDCAARILTRSERGLEKVVLGEGKHADLLRS